MRLISLIVFYMMGVMAGLPGQTIGPVAKEAGFSCGLNAAYIFLNRAGHHVAY
jgi:hypothetical protein